MILVTGGTGFLGAYVIKNLVEKGVPVRAIRRSSKLPFFIPKEINARVEWVEGDVLDVVSLDEAMQGVKAIVHSAAIVSFAKDKRREMYQVNVEGTANVVNTALENNIQRLVHVSSVAALGRTTKAETVSEDKKWEDNSNNTHYAISKHNAEVHAWRAFAEGMEGAIINPSTILGYGDWNQTSCAIFKNAYREFPWYTRGVNGFVGVEDVAEVAVQLLHSGINQKRFIVNAENWGFQQLFNCIAEGFHRKQPHREATKVLGEIAWRLESLTSLITRKNPYLQGKQPKWRKVKHLLITALCLEHCPIFSLHPCKQLLKNPVKNMCRPYKEVK